MNCFSFFSMPGPRHGEQPRIGAHGAAPQSGDFGSGCTPDDGRTSHAAGSSAARHRACRVAVDRDRVSSTVLGRRPAAITPLRAASALRSSAAAGVCHAQHALRSARRLSRRTRETARRSQVWKNAPVDAVRQLGIVVAEDRRPRTGAGALSAQSIVSCCRACQLTTASRFSPCNVARGRSRRSARRVFGSARRTAGPGRHPRARRIGTLTTGPS